MTTWLLGLALIVAPAARASWERVPATPVQEDLPDGELDLPDGDEDDPAAEPAPKPKPKPKPKPEPKPESKPEPAPEPVPKPEPGQPPAGDDVTPPPDERSDGMPAREPVIAPAPEPAPDAAAEPAQPWVDPDLAAEKDPSHQPVVDDDLHEIQVGGDGGRVSQVDDESSLLESPWFWGGVAGGAVLLVGGGVGTGVLIYTLLNADKGSVVITLE